MKTTQTKSLARKVYAFVLSLLLLMSFAGCSSKNHDEGSPIYPQYNTFRDVPGITQEEVEQIQRLIQERPYFVYGMCLSSETFYDERGDVSGYTELFCEWLTGLFGVPFRPVVVEWGDLQNRMQEGTIDFTGELTSNPERLKTYYMTSAMAERSIKSFRLNSASMLSEIVKERNPRFAFLSGANTSALLKAVVDYDFDESAINTYSEAVEKLRNKEIDAFFDDGPAEGAFSVYADIAVEDFFPQIFTPVSFSTMDPELKPIISVLQKCLDDGAFYNLMELYNEGQQEYLQSKLYLNLTNEEKEYLADHAKNDKAIPIAMEGDVYPVIFYNRQENEWQGIANDVLSDITALTGLRFQVVNQPDDAWFILFEMLESGQAAMTTELIYSSQREGRFLWADKPYTEDKYALLSTAEHADVNIHQVLYSKVGIVSESAYEDVFRAWFPEHPNTVAFMNMDDAFAALGNGEIDLLMTAKNLLLRETNYMENLGFKTNLVFDHSYGSSFGFNKDEAILCSIISKAQSLVDTEAITNRWISKVFDYQSKMLKSMIPYFVVLSSLLLVVLLVIVRLLLKNRRLNRNLNKLIEEKTAELSLQTATLMTVFESIPDLIFCKDLDSNFTQCNNSFKQHFNCLGDLIGKNDETGLGLPADVANAYRRVDQKIIRERKSVKVEEIIPAADGTFPLFETIKTPLIQNGEPVGLVCISRDITQHKVAEKELESASRAKGDFLSRMSHEIRTPLNAIIGMNNIALSSDDLEKIHQCNEKIEDASRHLLGVINDILDMSKIEADKFELSYSEFDFEKVLMSIINVTNFRAEEKEQEIVVNLSPDVPAIIFGDELRLSQVITNLLSNAVKFTPNKGSILLNIEPIVEKGKEITLQVEVIDNGIGISEEQQARLFTSFEQADSSTSRKFGGTGLGLAISKRIVELMGGSIWIESGIGRGSKFAFTIKVQKCEEKAHANISSKIDKNNIRILAVDDSKETLSCFSRVMRAHGLPCDVAENGADALDMIQQCEGKPYNIFFIDWHMPKMDGIELTKRIKQITGDNSVVFMISLAAWTGIEQEAFLAGVKSFIPKPVFSSSIINAINECLGVESVKTELRAQGADSIPNFSRNTILIAEDIEINQEIIKAILEATGVAVDFAGNGREAASMFRDNQYKYDLIFMDVQMPEMDGYEATRHIRSLDLERAKSIPIIAMTANVFKEDIDNCLEAGMNDHIGKPIDSSHLYNKLKEYLA